VQVLLGGVQVELRAWRRDCTSTYLAVPVGAAPHNACMNAGLRADICVPTTYVARVDAQWPGRAPLTTQRTSATWIHSRALVVRPRSSTRPERNVLRGPAFPCVTYVHAFLASCCPAGPSNESIVPIANGFCLSRAINSKHRICLFMSFSRLVSKYGWIGQPAFFDRERRPVVRSGSWSWGRSTRSGQGTFPLLAGFMGASGTR
jgi:hypothetical protein